MRKSIDGRYSHSNTICSCVSNYSAYHIILCILGGQIIKIIIIYFDGAVNIVYVFNAPALGPAY